MRRMFFTSVVALVVCGNPAYGQVTDSGALAAADSLAAAQVGARVGEIAGRSASVSGERWASVATTFFLTPFVGGLGVVIASSSDPRDVPRAVPQPSPPVEPSAAYTAAFRDAYREAFIPRRRRAMRSAALVTTVVFFAGAALLGG